MNIVLVLLGQRVIETVKFILGSVLQLIRSFSYCTPHTLPWSADKVSETVKS